MYRSPVLLLPLLAALACGGGEIEIAEPDFRGGTANVQIALGEGVETGSLRVWLDGTSVEAAFVENGSGVEAALPIVAGPHVLDVQAHGVRGGIPFVSRASRSFEAPAAAPALARSAPADGDVDVARSAWLDLQFAAEPREETLETFELVCDGQPVAFDLFGLGGGRHVLNPAPALPADAACRLAWAGPSGPTEIAFATAAAGPAATVLYDRGQQAFLAPFPDDAFLVPDPSMRTGQRLAVPLPQRGSSIELLFLALIEDTKPLDGWSPIAPLVVPLSDPVDPASVPTTPAASLDPLASVRLLDLAPGRFGEPVPFRMDVRSDVTAAGDASSVLMLFPSQPLRSEGRYALLVTRRAFADPGRPLEPSPFFLRVLAPPEVGEAAEVSAQREILGPVWEALEENEGPPIPREDLALALRLSVRSTDDLALDPLAMKQQVLAAPPPALIDYSVEPPATADGDIAAVVRGVWDAPDWRAQGEFSFRRDADGRPVVQRTRPVEFVLAIPKAAELGPVPVIFHQHGNPGSQEEVVSNARRFLAGGGFAVAGFTDILNREVAPPQRSDGSFKTNEERIEEQTLAIFLNLLLNLTLPDYWMETTGEQLAFLRFLQSDALADLDVVPPGGDGVPDLDLEAALSYHGISEGGNNGQALVPYAPELAAAALMVGGARLAEVLIHQQADLFLDLVPAFFPGITPAEIWTGLALFQTIFDRQDRHNQLEFAFRRPVEVAGTTRKPSLLVVEGLDDSLVPNHATESAAWMLGLPHLPPVLRPVPFLEPAGRDVLRGNLGEETTGAFVQYAPTGLPDVPPTPGCEALSPSSGSEGHFCAQSAAESRAQRLHFFLSALDGVPEIVNPFAVETAAE